MVRPKELPREAEAARVAPTLKYRAGFGADRPGNSGGFWAPVKRPAVPAAISSYLLGGLPQRA